MTRVNSNEMALNDHRGARGARIHKRCTIAQMYKKAASGSEPAQRMQLLDLPRLFRRLREMFARRVIVAAIIPNNNAVRVTVLAENRRPRRWH
jgi:hypothetical protein